MNEYNRHDYAGRPTRSALVGVGPTGFFQIDSYKAYAKELPHGVEYVATVLYRVHPDEPRCAHTRTFSSIARGEEMAIRWVNNQVEQWEREMRGVVQS